MENVILTKIEKEVLPKISAWTDISKKISKLTLNDYRNLFDIRCNKELKIKSRFIFPASESEFKIIGNVLLYMVQNPDSKATGEILGSVDLIKMIDNILKQ